MSYILDALKKAERERGLAKVPTLSSMHESRSKPNISLLAASTVALAILVVGFGAYLLLSSWKKSPAEAIQLHDTEQPQAATDPAASAAVSAPRSIPTAEPLASSAETPAVAPQPGTPPAVYGKSGRQPKSSTARQEIRPQAAATLQERMESTGSASNPDVQPDVSEADIQTPPANPSSPAPPAVESPLPAPASGRTGGVSSSAALKQALDGMSITILRFAQNPANRLVFINGRKYVEGDYIDGRFLIETITSDGVVLSYEGTRATLKASGY